jgi:hypothetical protein
LNGQVEYSQVSSPTCLGFSTTPTIPLIILVIALYSFIAKWVKSGFLMIVPIYAKLSTGRKLYLKYHEEEKLD